MRDKTRPSRIPPLGADVAERVVKLTPSGSSEVVTHWTSAMAAKACGISGGTGQRTWRVHGLQPHKIRQLKLSDDPKFVEKMRDIVGLHVDSLGHAIVLSVDGKSEIQGPDRTQPRLPMKKGRAGTMSHDHKRNGTTTLLAAPNVLEGEVIGRCMQWCHHEEFIDFLNAIEAEAPNGKAVHVVLDNYAIHKHPAVLAWLARHKRFAFHFTPISSSWLNAVEGYFAKLTNQRLKRGVFHSVVELQSAINRFIEGTNQMPKPFVWTADPKRIVADIKRGHQVSDSIHKYSVSTKRLLSGVWAATSRLGLTEIASSCFAREKTRSRSSQ